MSTPVLTHARGTCHFCHEANAEFGAHTGVYYDGCARGSGILRIWYLNNIFRPPGSCPCTDACDAHDAEHGINRAAWRPYA